METEYVVTLSNYLDGAGDIAPMAAFGVVRTVQHAGGRFTATTVSQADGWRYRVWRPVAGSDVLLRDVGR